MTLAELANHFRGVAARAAAAPEVCAQRTAPVLVTTAREVIGTHVLRDLMESTQRERERLGFTPNDPLKRTGRFQDSIEGGALGTVAFAGTSDPLGKIFEYGSVHMAPFSQNAITRDLALPKAVAIAAEVAREALEG